jgi:hypothetical protein
VRSKYPRRKKQTGRGKVETRPEKPAQKAPKEIDKYPVRRHVTQKREYGKK